MKFWLPRIILMLLPLAWAGYMVSSYLSFDAGERSIANSSCVGEINGRTVKIVSPDCPYRSVISLDNRFVGFIQYLLFQPTLIPILIALLVPIFIYRFKPILAWVIYLGLPIVLYLAYYLVFAYIFSVMDR